MGSLQSTIMAGLSSLFSLFSTSIKDIGIDLGTANTLVYVRAVSYTHLTLPTIA